MTCEHDPLSVPMRAAAALREEAELIDAATATRLARARAAAVASAGARARPTMRYLAPAGALGAVAVVALLWSGHDASKVQVYGAPAALGDLELLVDADALVLAEEADLEFIEWAAAMAELEGPGG